MSLNLQKTRPNIIFMITDDQRSDAMGCAGNSVLQTPHMDQLANEGVRFENAFTTTAICCVSRASILSGQYARRHGIKDFSTFFSPEALKQTYPALLQDAGYYTGFIGKWGVDAGTEWTERVQQPVTTPALDQSANLFDFWAGQGYQSNYWHDRTCNYVQHNGVDDKTKNTCSCPPDAKGYVGPEVRSGHLHQQNPVHVDTEIVPEKTQQFLDSRDSNKPFCLSISFKAPHGPFHDYDPLYENLYNDGEIPLSPNATLEHAARKPRFVQDSLESDKGRRICEERGQDALGQKMLRDYYRQLTGVDAALGKIRQELADRGLAENTIIIYSADHGTLFGEHGLFGKWLMYEASIRIPMLIFDPRLPASKRGLVNNEMVLNMDSAPTMLELAGVDIPEQMQGQSMVPLLSNEKLTLREDWFYEHHFSVFPKLTHIERSEGVRTQKWKYIRYIDQDPSHDELYDLEADPYETENLANSHDFEDILQTLRNRRLNYLRELAAN